jgi:phospholipid/cholesterol/gamma-HCH transport system substrate-binding protein
VIVKTRSLELVVGLFMLAGMLALLLIALRVSGLSLSSPGKTYTLTAYFDNIGGLTARSKVTMSGVKIGQVESVRLDHDEMMARVDMSIRADVDYLPQDSIASILTSGLLGEQFIGISLGGAPDSLADGDIIYDTQPALILEDLIGKFLMNSTNAAPGAQEGDETPAQEAPEDDF